jgi:predicted GNAT superfamily acetyltransferase
MTALIAPPFNKTLMAELLALNNTHAEELSYKSPDDFKRLMEAASHVRAEPHGLALIVAFDESCTYDNPNFAWLKARFERCYYIDRVVVAGAARGRGLARAIYAELEGRARGEGRERLVCEINSVPPNPKSDAFHEALGFRPIGSQDLPGTGKTVRYWVREFS